MQLKVIPLFMVLCFISVGLLSQNKTYQIKADSVRIFSNCDTAELILQNRTRNVLNGVLTNKGNGVTEFRKLLTRVNDCTYLIGGDSLKLGACNSGNLNSMAWLLNGNTVGAPKTLGTIDNVDLPFITNNAERLRITAGGNILLGTTIDNDFFKIQVNGNMSVSTHAIFNNAVAIGDRNALYRTAQGITGGGGYTPLEILGSNQGWASSMIELGCVYPGALKDLYNTVNESAIVRIKGGWGNVNTDGLAASTLAIEPTIKINGGSGTTIRGIYYNPTLTNINNGTHIAFQNTIGNNIFNSTSGNTLIGNGINSGSKLQVNGSTLINIENDVDNFKIKSSGSQHWRRIVDFNITDADGVSNSYGINVTAYNDDTQNRILKFNQYNATAVLFGGGPYFFEDKTTFNSGITNQYHNDFDITLRANTSNPNNTGIKFYAENFGATPIMSLMQNGKVGIGTSAPNQSVNLDVINNMRVSNSFWVDRADGNLSKYFYITARGANEASGFGNPAGNGAIEIGTYQTAGLILGTFSEADLIFGTHNTEQARITSNGSFGIGTSTPTAKLHTVGSVRFENLNPGIGDPLVIDADGNITRGGGTPSDLNLKENIAFSRFNTDKLLSLPIKDFNYKTDKNKTRYTGLIAQELKTVIPELVLGKEGSYSIDYVKMVPYLLKAIQDQQAMIQDQQKEIAELKKTAAITGSAATPDVLALVQQQLLQQQEEIRLLKEQIKNK